MKSNSLEDVLKILQKVVQILEQPETDVLYSRYYSAAEAVGDFNQHIERLRKGDLSGIGDLILLFGPTGSLQEISERSGWGEAFLPLAAEFDQAIESIRPR